MYHIELLNKSTHKLLVVALTGPIFYYFDVLIDHFSLLRQNTNLSL